MRSWLAALLVGPALFAVGTACSWCSCYPGMLPFDGATDVAPEGPFFVQSSQWTPETVALDMVRLSGPSGEIDVRVEVDGDLATLWPEEALTPGDYELVAFDDAKAERQTHGHVTEGFGALGLESGVTRFTVGSAPRLMTVFVDTPEDTDEPAAFALFSEPVEASTLPGRLLVNGIGVPTTPIDAQLFLLDIDVEALQEPVPTRLLEGVEALSGELVPAAELELGPWGNGWSLERIDGGVWCNC